MEDVCWNGEAGRVMTEKSTGEEGRGRGERKGE